MSNGQALPSSDDGFRKSLAERYHSYLSTAFYFRDRSLRKSFAEALIEEREPDQLIKGPFKETPRNFLKGDYITEILSRCFDKTQEALPAFITKHPLYMHQHKAIEKAYAGENVVITTGTASGKTECFLYPVLMELYRQYLSGEFSKPGVRAMVLYPLNALANDQCERLRDICRRLEAAGSNFKPTFGKYIGETPEDENDVRYSANNPVDNELLTREQIRISPPQILLTNYSMLEYLLIRPADCELFDDGRGSSWKTIILDEAHEYRGTKGIEIGMLMRRLRHRLINGGNEGLNYIAASATLASENNVDGRKSVANFASELFGAEFKSDNIIFSEDEKLDSTASPARRHYFIRALDGAYISYNGEKETIQLNNRHEVGKPFEIALCRECGQHYIVGQQKKGVLVEADRDQSSKNFGVEYYLPIGKHTIEESEVPRNKKHVLNRNTGHIYLDNGDDDLDAEEIKVMLCDNNTSQPDWIKHCVICRHQTQNDPVHEIVHNNDDPNSAIATALHQYGTKHNGKVLTFSDSRLGAAYFAAHLHRFYKSLSSRGFIFRTIRDAGCKLSIEDLVRRLVVTMENEGGFYKEGMSEDEKNYTATKMVIQEALTKSRTSLAGVGLVKWTVDLPQSIQIPTDDPLPSGFTRAEIMEILHLMVDWMRIDKAVQLSTNLLTWSKLDTGLFGRQQSVRNGKANNKLGVKSWFTTKSSAKTGYLKTLYKIKNLGQNDNQCPALMEHLWKILIKNHDPATDNNLLHYSKNEDAFRLWDKWIRCEIYSNCYETLRRCERCAGLQSSNLGNVCINYKCHGKLSELTTADNDDLNKNYYRTYYDQKLPPRLRAEEHTAQLEQEMAKAIQHQFKDGSIDLLSSSTTFEMGVDLGNLDTVFMCNVPPEPFNYIQRSGRAGRRERPGTVVTYCRRVDHDRYHYIDPEKRIMKAPTRLVPLKVNNTQIIARHAAAVLISSFFKENKDRFGQMHELYNNAIYQHSLCDDLRKHAYENNDVELTLKEIIPSEVWEELGLIDGSWVDLLVGFGSRLAKAETALRSEYKKLYYLKNNTESSEDRSYYAKRMSTIKKEAAISFLSRKAIIPKYGFPVDVVDLDLSLCENWEADHVRFSRDLAQAIVEYAPGSGLVARKKSWRSYGLRLFKETMLPVKYYKYDNEFNFTAMPTEEKGDLINRYLVPEQGFLIERNYIPKFAFRRPPRQHSTRPYFLRYCEKPTSTDHRVHFGLVVTKALPAEMVVLCEGKRKQGFDVCFKCGAMVQPGPEFATHKTPYGDSCNGSMSRYALGHQFVTSVVRLHPQNGTWSSSEYKSVYAMAFALMYGVAAALEVPDSDLNVTVIGGQHKGTLSIVLYDNVPGGAGLVDKLFESEIMLKTIFHAKERIAGHCGCGENSSCYGCLRSWRNQFIHKDLRREDAINLINELPV